VYSFGRAALLLLVEV